MGEIIQRLLDEKRISVAYDRRAGIGYGLPRGLDGRCPRRADRARQGGNPTAAAPDPTKLAQSRALCRGLTRSALYAAAAAVLRVGQ